MRKICMIEYQGRCDEQGKAVGHAPKVLTEYYEFIKNDFEVNILAPKVILRQLPLKYKEAFGVLPCKIIMKGKNNFFEKLLNKLYMFHNIKLAIAASDADVLWFFNVEYYLMLYLFLHKKPKQKIICTFFLEGYHGKMTAKIKQWVFERAQKKMELIISSGEHFSFKNVKTEFVPDYYYRKDVFDQFQNVEKKNLAVCLGTMGKGKELEEMVSAFNKLGAPLKVAGRFYDKGRFEKLKKMAAENVEILDSYLSEKDYLSMLAEASYVVLPYAPSQYGTQTSGVMQEAIFVNTIVITYEEVLKNAGVKGIGFLNWTELANRKFADLVTENNTDEIRNQYKNLIDTVYQEEQIQAHYHNIFEGV